MSRYSLVLEFDTGSTRFALGFEVGRLWEKLKATDEPVEEMIHTANVEMALRMAESLGRPVVSEEHDETWMTVRFGEPDDRSAG